MTGIVRELNSPARERGEVRSNAQGLFPPLAGGERGGCVSPEPFTGSFNLLKATFFKGSLAAPACVDALHFFGSQHRALAG